ncbi:two-component system, NarL family, sensor histidine kinase DesK [Frankia sp. AiPs1]
MLDGLRRWLLAPVPERRPGDRGMDSWRWRRVGGVFLIYLGYAVSDMTRLHDGAATIAFGCVLLVAFSVVYLWVLPLAVFEGRSRYRYPLLAGMAACILVYLPTVGGGGLVMTVYLTVAVTLVLRPIASIPLTLAIAAVDTWLPGHIDWWQTYGPQWSTSAPVLFAALTMHCIRAGARNQAELHRANQEIERLAKEQERLRIARDLHDLLGHALTTITVKAELASKLAGRDPARAADEMAQVAVLGRQGLADVRATVAGYREVSLVTELAAARQVLAAAGIRAELPASGEGVPDHLRELFGWVVREGVTNAVRHSGAGQLQVAVGDTFIEIVDDGRGRAAPAPVAARGPSTDPVLPSGGSVRPGTGLAGLSERVQAASGRLHTGPARPDTPRPGFRLRVDLGPTPSVSVPVPASASARPSSPSPPTPVAAEHETDLAGSLTAEPRTAAIPAGPGATTSATDPAARRPRATGVVPAAPGSGGSR